MSERTDRIRKSFAANDDIRDAGLTTPAEICRYDNAQYGPDAVWQRLDVYRPRSALSEMLPVIVSVHGGGWVYGDKERYQYYCMDLASRGYAVINFTYRLAPEFRFPAPLEDTALVLRWLARNAAACGLDTEHVFAVGDSAGAQILALYACMQTNPACAAAVGIPLPDVRLRALALNCGPYQFDRPDWQEDLMEEYLPGGGNAGLLRLQCVPYYVTSAFPPAFLMTCTGDFLIRQTGYMADALRDHGVPFVYRFYTAADRELGHVFHLDIRTREAAVCSDDECAFFEEYMD